MQHHVIKSLALEFRVFLFYYHRLLSNILQKLLSLHVFGVSQDFFPVKDMMSFQPMTLACQIVSRMNMRKINFFHLLLLVWQYPATPYFQVRAVLLIYLELQEKTLPPEQIPLAIGLVLILPVQCSGEKSPSLPPWNCFSLHLFQLWQTFLVFVE